MELAGKGGSKFPHEFIRLVDGKMSEKINLFLTVNTTLIAQYEYSIIIIVNENWQLII